MAMTSIYQPLTVMIRKDQQIFFDQELCDCKICKVAKVNFMEARKLKGKRGRQKKEEVQMTAKTNILICGICYAKIHPGINHDCSDGQRSQVFNIEALVDSPTTSEILASRVINEASPNKSLATLSSCRKSLCSGN